MISSAGRKSIRGHIQGENRRRPAGRSAPPRRAENNDIPHLDFSAVPCPSFVHFICTLNPAPPDASPPSGADQRPQLNVRPMPPHTAHVVRSMSNIVVQPSPPQRQHVRPPMRGSPGAYTDAPCGGPALNMRGGGGNEGAETLRACATAPG